MGEIFDVKWFESLIGEFEKIWHESEFKAKKFFLKKIGAKMLAHPVFSYRLGMSKLVQDRRRYLELTFMKFYTPCTYDYARIMQRCRECWLPSYAENKAVDFCTYLVKSK
jgi:uncharacterized radical SAM superfamily Fe-S cluster-containing enzyme